MQSDQLKRREFITLLGGAAAAWPLAASAQQGEPVRRVGVLLPSQEEGDQEYQARLAAFVQALRDLGWIEGRNVLFEERYVRVQRPKIRANVHALGGRV